MEEGRKRLNEPFTVKVLAYCAVCVALAVVASNIKLFRMPQGGSVCAGRMFFVTVAGYWFGPAAGMLTGVASGLVELIIDPYIVHPAQLITDYILAFGALGVSGFFRYKKNGLYTGYIAGVLGRFLFTWLSGVVFFSEYAPEGQNVMLYSLIYNGSYFLPEALGTLVLLAIPAFSKAVTAVSAKASIQE